MTTQPAKKRALITGITGQDGSYLTELLLEKNYEVHGIIRRSSNFNTQRIDHIYKDLHDELYGKRVNLHYGDMSDASSLYGIVARVRPDEVYNLAAQSHVRVSFECPLYTGDIDALGTLRLLEAIRHADLNETRFYQASSSEMFGKVAEIPQTEKTAFYPRSPYAISKVFSYWAVVNSREAYGMHASNGILFNHESPRRGMTFVTRKISRAVASIKLGKQKCLYLGNLEAKRDWGCAQDYVYMMWLMLQQEKPDDYVVSTGETHTVREFVEKAFLVIDIKLIWVGSGLSEVGVDEETNDILVRVDSRYYRPTEVDILIGCSDKAKQKLGWVNKSSFDDLVKEMVLSDYVALGKESE